MCQSKCLPILEAARGLAVGMFVGTLCSVVLALACYGVAMILTGFGAMFYSWMSGMDVTDAMLTGAVDDVWLALMVPCVIFVIRDAYRFSKRKS